MRWIDARVVLALSAIGWAACSDSANDSGGPPDATTGDSGGALPDAAEPADDGDLGSDAGPLLDGSTGDAALDAALDAATECLAAEPDPFVDERALHAVPLAEHAFFRIQVVDQTNDQPLAGAQLETTNHIVLHADVNGVVAFYEPGLMGSEVYFDVRYPGFTRPADGFGYTGVRLQVSEGGSAQVEMQPTSSATPPVVTSDEQSRLAGMPVPGPSECHAIEVVDSATGRGVPLVRAAIEGSEYWTDSSGLIAFCELDRIGQVLDVALSSHGYTARDAQLELAPGAASTVELERINLAERLYRVTGQGIYRDSLILGRDVPLKAPAIAGGVLGQDTVQTAIYQGKVFWVWGDTTRASYPLGNFHTSSARSELPASGGLRPSAGVDLDYYVGSDGFSKPMAPPETVPGDGVTWLGPLFTVNQLLGSHQERLFATYALVPGVLEADEMGIVEFDDAQELFVKALQFPAIDSIGPRGHPTRYRDFDGGDNVYFQQAFRIVSAAEAIVKPEQYETFTALAEASGSELVRNTDGSLAYAWQHGTGFTTRQLLEAQSIPLDQALDGHLTDPQSGDDVARHDASSRTWNAHRNRFVEMVQQIGGDSSFMGEIWYAEADTPVGPWVYARKIVSHDQYTFYNPRQHTFFDEQGGRRIYFEGTYVTTFAGGNLTPTPRYDYNQVMYRLDVDDPRVALPVAVYDDALGVNDVGDGLARSLATKEELAPDAPPVRAVFFAPDRPLAGHVAIGWSAPSCRERHLVATPIGEQPPTPPLFYALPASTPEAELPSTALPLYEHASATERGYAAGAIEVAGFTRAPEPLGYVYRSPIAARLPVASYLGELDAYAGQDICINAAGAAKARVLLNASGSRTLNGEPTDAAWIAENADGSCITARGVQAVIELAPGSYVFHVEVTNVDGQRGTDTVLVEISP